jgi:peptidyl-tRNA hydrolase, PTH1 family
MKIIAFLGNPGKKYANNRHNAGFIAGIQFADTYNIALKKKEAHYTYGKSRIGNEDILLVFPNTFMNNSGLAVNSALNFFSESVENLIAVHDEIELPFGEIRVKTGGGHKGHNGIRSIIQYAGSADFARVRIGVGRPDYPEIKVADFLLSDFTKEELEKLKEHSPRIIQIINGLIGNDIPDNSK